MSAVYTAVATTAVGAYSAYKSGKAADRAASAQADIANRQAALSEEQWNYYKDIYRPVEKSLAEQATQGIDPDYPGVTGRASTTVNNAFDKATEIGNRNMYRLGLNPNSGNAMALNRGLDIERARTDANAQNDARETERRYVNDINFNRRLAVAGTGKGLPSSAQYGLASAGAMQGQVAQNYGNAAYNTSRFIGGLPWGQMFNQTPGMGVIGDRAASGQLGPPNVDVSSGSDWSGYGAGGPSGADYFGIEGMADGGEIEGPGTGTSDSIPIRASDGEYVIPADVVKRKGTEFFDKMVEKHHTPARGLSFMRPGEQAMDMPMGNGMPMRDAMPMNNGGPRAYANGGMVHPAHKSTVTLREKTRKALANIGL